MNFMNYMVCILIVTILQSCQIFQEPTFRQPRPKDVTGDYIVQKVSWFAPNRNQLKKVSLTLASNGTYQLHFRDSRFASPLIPPPTGKWVIESRHGLDIGSNATWTVRFSPLHETTGYTSAWLLGNEAPHKLMFDDYSRVELGDLLIMKRVESGRREVLTPAPHTTGHTNP